MRGFAVGRRDNQQFGADPKHEESMIGVIPDISGDGKTLFKSFAIRTQKRKEIYREMKDMTRSSTDTTVRLKQA